MASHDTDGWDSSFLGIEISHIPDLEYLIQISSCDLIPSFICLDQVLINEESI